MFLDNEESKYSIHQICWVGGKIPGEWYGPHSIATCIKKLCDETNDLKCELIGNGMVDLKKLWE